MPTFLPYSDDVETISPDERDTFERITAVMGKAGDATEKRYGHYVRVSHAKAHGLVRGELRVLPDLPPELAQGLFATPKTYPAIVRLAHVPGELLDDRKVSTPRGLAIKILEVDGEMLPANAGARTQDWVLDTGKYFIAGDATKFLAEITATDASLPLPEAVKGAVSAVSHATNKALNAVGLNSANLDFFGHPKLNPLTESYYSQAAIRYGDYIAKLAFIPDTAALRDFANRELDLEDENGLRTAVVRWFREHAAEFTIAVQLCTDLDRMPVEHAGVEWPEDESPYRPVGRLVLPPQDAYSQELQNLVEGLSFCPAHSLAAHRPLGSIMRARMHAYELLGKRRRERNGRTTTEPATLP